MFLVPPGARLGTDGFRRVGAVTPCASVLAFIGPVKVFHCGFGKVLRVLAAFPQVIKLTSMPKSIVQVATLAERDYTEETQIP